MHLNEYKSDTSQSSLTDSLIASDNLNASETIKQSKDVIDTLNERRDELERLNESLPILKREIKSQIDQSIQMIQIALNERHDFLLNELDSAISTKSTVINRLQSEFESRLQRLSSHVDLLKRFVQMSPSSTSSHSTSKSNSNAPTRNIAVQKHRQEIEKLLIPPVPLHPSEYDTMSFFPTDLDHLLSMIRCLGVIGLTSVAADKTTVSRNPDEEFSPIRRCELYEEAHMEILPRDSMGRCVENPNIKDFSVSLTSRSDYVTEIKMCDLDDPDRTFRHQSLANLRDQPSSESSNLQLIYKVSTPGAYDLSIKLYGEHIQGSPLIVYARQPSRPEMQILVDTMRELSERPNRVQSVLSTRRRCRSEPINPIIMDVLDAYADLHLLDKGDFLYSFGTKGRGDGEFANPIGVCVTRDNRILVADSNNASIQVFDTKGKFILRFGEYGYQQGQLMRPMDVAETINGNYLVSDYDQHCVNVYNKSGAYMSRFGQRYLAGPKGLIADSRGRILVVDQKSCMVCIFKPTGKFINRFGARGNGDNQFTNPITVAMNSQDEIYVCDYTQHAIKVFDPNGLYLFRFGVNGLELGMLHSPTGLVFDKYDQLYISDCGNNRIQVFNVHGDFLRVVDSRVEPLLGPHGITVQNSARQLIVTDPGNYCIKVYQVDESGSKAVEEEMENGQDQHQVTQQSSLQKSSSDNLSLSR